MFRVRCGQIDLDRRLVLRGEEAVELTPVEVSVLRYLQARAGRIVPREELLREVWGYAGRSRSQAVHVAMRRLRTKIERDPSAPDHLKTIPGVGWVLELDPAAPVSADLVGRDDLLGTLLAAVAAEALVVLVGPGGIGKTTIARAVLRSVRGVFLDLSAAADGPAVDAALGRALDVDGEIGAEVWAEVGLVVLDNVEQVAIPTAERIPGWIGRGARLLLTSRVRVGASAGRTVPVGPLDEAAAVALLVERARSVGAPDPTSAELGDLVRALECNPLCLELAAPRLRLLSPSALSARLQDRFAVLRTTETGRPDRHLALEASIDLSWQLLGPREQAALADLTVFRGGFGPDAAEAVIDGGLDLLQALLDASLIHRTGDRLEPYVSVQELVQLRISAVRRAEAELRHGRWFGARDPHAIDPSDIPNVVAAVERALDRGDAAVATAGVHALGILAIRLAVPGLDRLLTRALPLADGIDRLRLVRLHARRLLRQGEAAAALAALGGVSSEDPLQEGLIRELRSTVLLRMGRLTQAEEELSAAAQAFERADRPENRATVQINAANLARLQGRTHEAEALMQLALQSFRALGSLHGEAIALGNLAGVLTDRGRLDSALRALRDAIALLDRASDRYGAALMRSNLAELLLEVDGVAEADLAAHKAHEDARGIDLWAFAHATGALGQVALRGGDPDAARGWLLEAVATATRCGNRTGRAVLQRHLARALRAVGDEAGATALLDEAIAALEGRQQALALCDRRAPGDLERAAELVRDLDPESIEARAVRAAR